MNQPPPIQPSLSASSARTSALAIWSMILGILGICCICLAIPAVICGHLALGRIKRSLGALTGSGMAIAGLVTGYIGIALGIVWIIAMLSGAMLPALAKAKNRAQQINCINNLRIFDLATQQWAMDKNKQPTDVPTRADLEPYLKDLKMISLACPAGGTYTLHGSGEHPTCSLPGHELPASQ